MHKYICESHQTQIKFVCFNSQWHCDFLCEECIPIHNNSHLQNKTPLNLQSLEELYNDSFQKVEKMMEFLDKNTKLLEISQINIENYNFNNNFDIKRVVECKESIIKKVEDFFNTYINMVKSNIALQRDNMTQKIQNLSTENRDLLEECQNLINNVNENKIENIKNIIKFSKKNAQQIKDENRDNIVQTNILSELSDKNITIDINKISEFDDLLKKVLFIDKKKKLLTKEKEKIQAKNVEKKKCKICGGNMKYISDFKKHLTCEGCNNVTRLYG